VPDSGEHTVEFTGLPGWADQFIHDLDDRFGVLSGDRAAENFPDGRAPRWLRGEAQPQSGGAPNWIDSFFMNAERSLEELWLDHGFLSEDPTWLADLLEREQARVARVFVLTGNIHDYAFNPDVGYQPVIDRLEASAIERKDWVIRYSLSNGFAHPTRGVTTAEDEPTPLERLGVDETGRHEQARNPREAIHEDFRIMEEILARSYDRGICLIIENLHMLLPPQSQNLDQNVLSDAIQRWAQAPWMFQSDNQVILLANSLEALDSSLQSNSSHIESLEIPRPEAREDRLKFLISLFAGPQVDPMTGIRMDARTRPRFAQAFGDDLRSNLTYLADRTSGLNLVGLENLVLQVNVSDDPTFTIEFIKDAKREILSQESGGLLEVSEPDAEVDREAAFDHIGGLDRVCEKLLQVSQMMDASNESEIVRRALPKGLLFLGPPGTGKTLVARAFANACGVNFAELGNIRSMWVGESERNLSQALDLIRSLKPVIVFMDEIDQSMGQRGGATDSGVDQRIFARILQFMSDPELEGEVIWIGASNEPQQIDPALKRAGRFDLTIPFFRPTPDARRQIFRIQFEERDAVVDFSESEWEQIVDWMEGYTGAEIEGLAKEAIWQELVDGSISEPVEIPFESVRDAFETYQPPVNRTEYRRMENEALLEITAVDMLTEEQRGRRDRLLDNDIDSGNPE
jgi:AAA+ superfamily predicted ATPase